MATPTPSASAKPHLLPAIGDPGAAEGLRARLSRLHPATRPLWGRMAAVAMLRHLNDAFETMDGTRPLQPGPARRGTTFRAWTTKVLALYAPVPWPRGLRTAPSIDQERGGTTPRAFDVEAATLLAHVHRYAAGEVPLGRHHPFIGTLSAWEWQRWAYLHVDHHFRQFGLERPSTG
jgi:hypothetical protein